MIVIGSCGTYCRTVWTLERIWNIFLRCGKMKQSEPIYIFMHPYSPFPRRWDSWKTDWVWKIARPCIWVWKIARPCIWFKWTDPLSLSHLSHDDLKTPFSLSHLSHVLQLVPTYPILSYHLSFTNSLFWDFFLGLKLPFHFSKNTSEWKVHGLVYAHLGQVEWFKWTDPLSLSRLSHEDLKTPFSLFHLSH